eukprot:186977-Chlamydomonas_euryale.AAC.1
MPAAPPPPPLRSLGPRPPSSRSSARLNARPTTAPSTGCTPNTPGCASNVRRDRLRGGTPV